MALVFRNWKISQVSGSLLIRWFWCSLSFRFAFGALLTALLSDSAYLLWYPLCVFLCPLSLPTQLFFPQTHILILTPPMQAWVAIMLIISNYSSNTVHAHVCINPNRNFPTQWIASVILSTFTYIYISPMIWLHLHFQPIGASSIDGTLYSRPMSFLHHVTLIIRDQWI